MTVFLCVDNNMGMAFGGKRQSRDREVISDILKSASMPLYINSCSEILFKNSGFDFIITDDIFKHDGCCFAENVRLEPHINKIGRLVIYKWNRTYPADLFLDIEPSSSGFYLYGVNELTGFSHEKITKEIWVHE